MQVFVAVVVSLLVGFIVGVEMSKSVLQYVARVVADAHAAVAGGAKDVQDLASRVSALEKRVADAVKAEVAKV